MISCLCFTEGEKYGKMRLEKKGGSTVHIEALLPAYVLDVMNTLQAAGHKGYLVGGSLRDLLRGVPPHDYDLTTDATPEEMVEIFATFKVIPTGLKHGTLTVMSGGEPIEVTTHRIDGDYVDARHPQSVSFTRSLEGDLSRRDFTVNAMAWNPETGLVDLFGGQQDLQNGILRAVGDAKERFSEDALRILRAFRFAAQLCFEIDPQTMLGAKEAAEGLAKISVERIFAELCRMLQAPDAERGLAALVEAGCWKHVFFDAVMGVKTPNFAKITPDAALRLGAILPQLDKEQAILLCKRWHAPNAFGEALGAYTCAAREPLPTTPYEARCFVARYWHYWKGAMELRAAAGEDVSAAAALCRKVSRDGTTVELRRLAVNGKELQTALGVLPEQTGTLLHRLQDLVWREPECNKKDALLAAARKICEKERGFCE